MTAFSNLPAQAVLPLGAYDLESLVRGAERVDHRLLQADCHDAADAAGVLQAIGRDFGLGPVPDHGALLDRLSRLEPLEADPPGFLVVLRNLPKGAGFDAGARDTLLDVFRDAADAFHDRDTAFRVFYSLSSS